MNDITQFQGDYFSGFKMLRLLGQGGNGVVYQAHQLAIGRVTACKILYPEFANDPVYTNNFVREARLAARMEHPNIIQALDVGCDENLYYFEMEYVPGCSLEKVRTDNPEKITLLFLLNISIALADALDYAWQKFHIFHGDIKPDNLMLRNSDSMLKLADLGLAKIVGTDDLTGEIMATPLYAAPEVITADAANIGIKSDIYSFGIMLYELVSGDAPFKGNIDTVLQKHLDEIPPPLASIAPDIDRTFTATVDRMISKAPDKRPQDWAEIKKNFQLIKERIQNTPACRKPLHKPASYLRKKKNALPFKQIAGTVSAIVTLLILALLLFFIFREI